MSTVLRCIITGCDLADSDTGALYHGDLHEMENVYIFNAVIWKGDPLPLDRAPEERYIEAPLGSGAYFERRGVFIFPKALTTLSPAAEEYINA